MYCIYENVKRFRSIFNITVAQLLVFISLMMPQGGNAETSHDTSTIGISARMLAYVENTEYSNQFRTGETFLGSWLKTALFYSPDPWFTFRAGIYLRRVDGDTNFMTDYVPILSATFRYQNFSFTLGEVASDSCHGLPDVLYEKENVFVHGLEQGLQLTYKGRNIQQDLWVDWVALNTPTQREHFIAGDVTEINYGPFTLPIMALADHHGGQQYDPPNDPDRETFSGATGVRYSLKGNGLLTQFGAEYLLLGSERCDPSTQGSFASGWGNLATLWVSPWDFNVSVQWYKGRDLTASLGNPIFQTDKPAYFFGISREYEIGRSVIFNGGIRFDFVENTLATYFNNPQHRWWFSIQGDLDRILSRKID